MSTKKTVGSCRVHCIAAITGMLLVSGCGGPDGRLETFPVSGTVTLDGKPVPNATVTFVPVERESTRPAFGMTDEEGAYVLTTYQQGDGAVAGEFKISVLRREATEAIKQATPEQITPSGSEDMKGSSLYADMMMGRRRPYKTDKSIPRRYAKPDSSGLRQTVEPTDGNVFDFSLVR